MENMISIIIPVYREPFLNNTLESLLKNAHGEIEIIVVVDGYTLEKPILEDKRIRKVIHVKNRGMRGSINSALAIANGDYIMKTDAHCCFGRGYDTILTENTQNNWLVIPRRYSLDFERWDRNESKGIMDYHYLNYPMMTAYGLYMGPNVWKKWSEVMIDDTMAFQGSCWLAEKKYFMEHVAFLDDREETYGSFAQEQQEIGLKYWLGGGEVKVNKKTWYAHLSKRGYHYDAGLFSRKYKKSENIPDNNTWSTLHWLNNREPGMVHSFDWLIEKFWPVPTWPENWREQLEKDNFYTQL